MPLPRKKLKLVESGSAGRNKTRWIRPKIDESKNKDASETHNFVPHDDYPAEDSEDQGLVVGQEHQQDVENNDGRSKAKSYEEIKKKDVENWAKLRHQLLKTAVERKHPCVDCCMKCETRLGLGQQAEDLVLLVPSFDGVLFKCEDCGPFFFVCYACLLEDHQLRPNHIPEKWNGKFFEPFSLHDYNNPVQIPAKVHFCLSKYRRNMKFVDSKGNVQDKIYELCQCEPEALTLHKLNLWPSSSKKPTTVYSQDLLKTLKSLMLECHTSVLGFTNSMKWRNGLSSSQAESLYRLLVNESFEEFRNLSFKLETCLAVAPHIDDFSACMQCPKENGKIILMLDGTFGCVRKFSSGKSHEMAKHKNRFFLNESAVDLFVNEHSAAVKENKKDCNSFKAGTDKLRSKLQRSKLDVTGIFGCSCKHEIPVCFLNMKHGERLGYPIFLLQRVMQQYANKGIEFGILYDISCVLDKHIKKAGLAEQFKSCTFATPDWHSYGHISSCQIDYAVRFHPEFGLTDGEGVERLWSFIRRFTAITKEMTPSHRIDLLTDGLIHYGRRKNANIEKTLMERVAKAESIQKSTIEEICTLEKDCGVKITEEIVNSWRLMEKTALTKSLHGKGYDDGSEEKWREHYVEKLLLLEEARSAVNDCTTVQLVKQVQEQIKQLERDIKVVESSKEIAIRWRKHTDQFRKAHTRLEDKRKVGFLTRARSHALERIFHLALKRKYSDGQAIPNRLEKMIKKATKRLNGIVETYNESEFFSKSNIANKISFMDVKDPEGQIYHILDAGIEIHLLWTTVSLDMESKITKAAVGRFARIGEVYDERKDEFLSVNILTGSLTENDIFEDEANNVNVDFIVSDSISEKYEKLGIDAELSLSILSGLVKVSGSAAYLYDQKSSARTERMTLAYAVHTVHQELDGIRGKIDKDSLDAVEATHVVIGIDWGAKCNVTCEYENTENEEDTQVKGKLRAEIEKLKDIISLKGEANLDMKKNDRGKGNKFSFHSKCDVSDMDKDIPSSFEAAVKMATSLPSVVKKTNGGKGVPISYTMMSLATLRKMCKMQLKTGVICKKIEEDLVQRCLETMEDVTKTRQKIADLVSTVSENQDAALEDDIAKAQDLQKNFTRSEVKFKAKLMEKLVAVRSDELKTTALAKTLNDFLGDQNSPANASKEIGQFSTLSAKFKLVGHLKRRKVLYLGRNAMYEMALQQNSKKKLYKLYLRYSMELSDPMKWRQETDLFFRLLLAHNEDNEFQFIVVDCEVQADAETRMHIEFYDKGVLCLEDVLKEEGQDLENCTIKVENLQPLKHKPIKRVVLEIPCPKSFSGRCSTDNCQWICRSCKELIEYGIDDTHFYCKCGGGSCYSAVFQCNDNKHGLGYVLYPKDILRKVLDQLRMAKEINILILGETGVGKSTWINALANYLAFSSLAEAKDAEEMKVLIPSQFSYTSETGTAQEILVGEKSANEVLNAGQSATQGPKAYKFTVGKQVISLIDTPGIGDVRGLEQDEKNFEKILAHLSYYDEIHGICILLKPNDSRLTVTFRFCITELLLHLHKSAAENIIFCFTNARSTFYRPGDTLPILKKLISEYKGATVSVTPNNLFCFDNEAFRFLACLKNGVRFGEQDIQTYSSSWERAVGETEKLFKHIVQLKPHSVQHTVSLNNARRIILELSKPLAETAANVQINIDAAERKTKELKASKETASELKDKLYLDAIDLKSVGLDYPRTVCTDSSCVEYVHVVDNTQKTVYKQHCHPHCYLSGVPTESIDNTTLQGCAAMGGWPYYNCNQCGHSWRIHMHMTYDLERVNKRVIDNRVKILLDEKNDDASKLQCFITKVNSYVEELKQEQRQITDICAQFGCYLKKNAITPFNDEVDAHLQMLIKQEETKPDRSQKTIENLRQMRRKYDQKKQIITAAMENPNAKDNDFISEPGKVEELKKKLFALKHNGKQLEESFKTIQKAHSQYAHHEVQSMQIQIKEGSRQQRLFNSLKGAFSTGIKKAKNYLSLPLSN